MIFEIPTLITALYLLTRTKGSIVTDSKDQKGIYMSDYCPKSDYCPEGAHVLCMYYNPRSIMGPRCGLPRNVTTTRDIANKMLEIVNAFRSRLALGKETGKKGMTLPRAYGMYKLKWDNELATFAQVLANQCVLTHDLCRSSKRFPDPGQAAGIVRFTYPNWYPVSNNAQFNKNGLTLSKLNYANMQALKSWYTKKDFITPDMVINYPDWFKSPDKTAGRLFLEMVSSSATHLGCGMSAYTEYAYHTNRADLNYNTVQIVCNFSARPHKGQPVYNTNPPTEVGYTVRCGCPVGYDEDADCLCSENQKPKTPERSCDGLNCKPAVVLLPIFTVEDAPPSKLIGRSRPSAKSILPSGSEIESNTDVTSLDLFHSSNEGTDNDVEIEELSSVINNSPLQSQSKHIDDVLDNALREPLRMSRGQHRSPEAPLNQRIQAPPADKHYSKLHDQELDTQHFSDDHLSKKNIHPVKSSIFSKVHTFALPRKTIFRDVRRDVSPRRDFSNSQRLLNDYLNKKRKRIGIRADPMRHIVSDFEHQNVILDKKESAPLNRTINRYLRNKFHYQGLNGSNVPKNRFDIVSSNEESDKKLMDLLDNLEQEVKHIELDMDEKEIFDAKIRKIYGTVVGKRPYAIKPKLRSVIPTYQDIKKRNYIKYDSAQDNFEEERLDKRIYETEDRVKEAQSKFYDTFSENDYPLRPISRKQNAIIDDPKLKEKCGDSSKYPCVKRSPLRHTVDIEDIKLRPSIDDDKHYKNGDDFYKRQNKHNVFNDEILRDNVLEDGDYKENKHDGNSKKPYKDYDDESPKRIKVGMYDDPLGLDRRKYYHDKINNIERKLHDERSKRRRAELERDHTEELRMRPSRDELSVRPHSKTQMSQFYIQDRARFLHGF